MPNAEGLPLWARRAMPRALAERRGELADDAETIDRGGAVRNPSGASFTPQPERPKPPTAQARTRTGPPKPEEVALERGESMLNWPVYDSNPDAAWGPTLITAKPRHGKSQVQIARMLADMDADCEVVWMSTHATLYHKQDQPVDLRPLADRFEVLNQGKAIKERLNYYVNEVMEQRLARYTAGEDVGHPIALHIGEWPALVEQYGEDVAAPMRRLLREAPKTQIIVSTLDAQDAQVATLGLGGGVRNAFWHVLLGNVDEPSWRAFTDEPYRKVPARSWYVPGQGSVRFPQATERARRMVAAQPVTQAEQLPLPTAASPKAPAAATGDDDMLSQLLAREEDRKRRLAVLMAAQPAALAEPPPTAPTVATATFERGGNGDVNLTVITQPVATRRGRAKTPKEITHARRLRAAYIQAAQAGEKFDPTYKRLGGSRNEMSKLFNANKSNSAS
jgi:hypothetical protein